LVKNHPAEAEWLANVPMDITAGSPDPVEPAMFLNYKYVLMGKIQFHLIADDRDHPLDGPNHAPLFLMFSLPCRVVKAIAINLENDLYLQMSYKCKIINFLL